MDQQVLADLVEQGFSVAQIARELKRHPRIVSGWLREYGLQTSETVRRRQNDVKAGARREGICKRHGAAQFVARGDGSWRCTRCRSAQVSEARRRRKARLVAEAGGACLICGYDRCVAGLQFHHLDPDSKKYGLAHRGAARSLASMQAEAAKCVLLCSNCHAEIESGLIEMPIK